MIKNESYNSFLDGALKGKLDGQLFYQCSTHSFHSKCQKSLLSFLKRFMNYASVKRRNSRPPVFSK